MFEVRNGHTIGRLPVRADLGGRVERDCCKTVGYPDFQNKGVARGEPDQASKWQLSIDPCTKCHFM